MSVLVTGGAGYIGSHTVVALLAAGQDVVVVDDLSNASAAVIDAIEGIAGRRPAFVEADLAAPGRLDRAFAEHDITSVVHFAGLKSVSESVREPLRYFRVNIGSTLSLLEAMDRADVRHLVFSSSCTVYGEGAPVPIVETTPLGATSPYGRTKLVIEDLLRELSVADPRWTLTLLRYFNPVGAHPSGDLGEDPIGVPDNLMPYTMQVAVGLRESLTVFGEDYPTRDGTCVRDYIHVVDLAEGHLAALAKGPELGPGCRAINLGSGVGSTVLEVVAAAGRAVGTPIPFTVGPRRPGDVTEAYADPATATALLGWQATRDLDEMCADHWRWQSRHPRGYS